MFGCAGSSCRKGCPLGAVRGLLIAVASPVGVASRALLVQWSQRVNSLVSAPGLQSAYAVVGALGLNSFAGCGIFPDQELNPCLLHWLAVSFFATELPGKPKVVCFFIS